MSYAEPQARIVRLLLGILAAIAMTAVAAPVAAAVDYSFTGEFANAGSGTCAVGYRDPPRCGLGSGDGEFTRPGRAAVRLATDDLYVADGGNDRVEVFAPSATGATYSTQFGFGVLDDPFGIAIDQRSGAIYVSDTNDVVKFDSALTVDPTFTSPGVTGPIAVDPTTGDLLVADRAANVVRRYQSDGTPAGSFDGSAGVSSPGAFTGLLDIAVDSTGDIVVVDATGDVAALETAAAQSRVDRYDAAGVHEATIVSPQCADAPGSCIGAVAIDPVTDDVVLADNFNSYSNTQPLRLAVFDRDGSGPKTLTIPTDDVNDQGQRSTIWGVISGVALGQDHLYAITDIDFIDNLYGWVGGHAFRVLHHAAPVATTDTADQVERTTAKLRGEIDPNNLATSYWFEYGTSQSYGTSIPVGRDGQLDPAPDPVALNRSINGLSPATTYHYRLVARNALGTSMGTDRTFTTAPPASPPTSVGRGYELVSPPDKDSADLTSGMGRSKAALSGNAIAFTSQGAFADPRQARNNAIYLAQRTVGGWQTKSILPPQLDNVAFAPASGILDFSSDLSKSVIRAGDPPLTPGAQTGTNNLFLRDNTDDGYRLITPSGPIFRTYLEANSYAPVVAASSADYSHILFESEHPMTPDSPPDDGDSTNGIGVKLYEWVDGSVRLVGVMPNGDPAQGSFAGGFSVGIGEGASRFNYTQEAMSSDGARIFWTDTAEHQLYVRLNGAETVHVSASQRSTPDAVTEQAAFVGATPDGGSVYFTSEEKLTDDEPDASTGVRLYRFDVGTRRLFDLSLPESGTASANVLGLVGHSADGSRVYFTATGALAPGAIDRQPNLYLWSGGRLRYITTFGLSAAERRNWESNAFEGGGPKLSRVSADGRYVLLSSENQLTSYDTNGLRELYRYDADANQLRCVSCNPRTSRSQATASLSKDNTGSSLGLQRNMLDDGRIFFTTAEPLVGGDTNGVEDVYDWDGDRATLISTGAGSQPAYFADATPSGSDVFFTTAARLVGWDQDDNVDMYDARVGGGFPEPTVAVPCDGDACQGKQAGRPTLVQPSTDQVSGAADEAPPGRPKAPRPPRLKAVSASARAALAAGGKATVTVVASAPGMVTFTARARIGRRAVVVARASKRAARAGAVRLRIALSPRARQTLRTKRRLTLTLWLKGGSSATARAGTVTLRVAAKRGRAARAQNHDHKGE